MRSTIVAANFVVLPDANMGSIISWKETFGVGVPRRVVKFGSRRVEWELAGTAYKVSIVREEGTEFANARRFGSSTAEHNVLFPCQLLAPLWVGLLEWVGRGAGVHYFAAQRLMSQFRSSILSTHDQSLSSLSLVDAQWCATAANYLNDRDEQIHEFLAPHSTFVSENHGKLLYILRATENRTRTSQGMDLRDIMASSSG
jgi:hypothetical protein